MDGKMQSNYTHGVAEASEVKGKGNLSWTVESDRRMCIVFRHGKKKMYRTDTGIPCMGLTQSTFSSLEKKEMLFGRIRGLKEGYLYSREDMCRMGVHTSQQRGVSGNMYDGCDTIVVAGKGEVNGEDTMFELSYSASTSGGGAEGLCLSQENGFLVRVFRTNRYNHPNCAIVPCDYCHKKISGAFYRYDGLYTIKSFTEVGVEEDTTTEDTTTTTDNNATTEDDSTTEDDTTTEDDSTTTTEDNSTTTTEDDNTTTTEVATDNNTDNTTATKKRARKREFLFQLKRCSGPHNIIVGEDYMLYCRELGTLR